MARQWKRKVGSLLTHYSIAVPIEGVFQLNSSASSMCLKQHGLKKVSLWERRRTRRKKRVSRYKTRQRNVHPDLFRFGLPPPSRRGGRDPTKTLFDFARRTKKHKRERRKRRRRLFSFIRRMHNNNDNNNMNNK